MKITFCLLTVVLAGCQSAPPEPMLPAPARKMPAVQLDPPTPPAPPAPDPKIRQQAQLIEALISQNDALTMKLAQSPPVPVAPQVAPATALVVPPTMAPAIPVAPPNHEPAIMPNADGLIDLTATDAAASANEPVNPFAVRNLPEGKTREVTLRVGGIIAGATPCAVVNDRLVQTGDAVDAFTVESIEADAVVLRHADQRLRLPVAEKPVRVRLPLL
jgi:hypothetical protein